MKFSDYIQNVVKRTESQLDQNAPIDVTRLRSYFRLVHAVAELMDAFKRQTFYGTMILNAEWDQLLDNIEAELNDIDASMPPGVTSGLTKVDKRFLHGVIGMITEVGELAQSAEIVLASNEITAPRRKNILEELGDGSFYEGIVIDSQGFTLEEVLQANDNKLRVRYPQKFTQQAAENRNIDAEMDALGEADSGKSVSARRIYSAVAAWCEADNHRHLGDSLVIPLLIDDLVQRYGQRRFGEWYEEARHNNLNSTNQTCDSEAAGIGDS